MWGQWGEAWWRQNSSNGSMLRTIRKSLNDFVSDMVISCSWNRETCFQLGGVNQFTEDKHEKKKAKRSPE
jgi:hypothetical protein